MISTDDLTTGLVGLGIIAAALWNGWETYQTKRIAREQAHKVDETHRQVSVNKHVSDPPTLLDKVDRVHTELAGVKGDIAAAATMFEGHINLSAEDRAALWQAIAHLRKEIRR